MINLPLSSAAYFHKSYLDTYKKVLVPDHSPIAYDSTDANRPTKSDYRVMREHPPIPLPHSFEPINSPVVVSSVSTESFFLTKERSYHTYIRAICCKMVAKYDRSVS